MSAQIFGEWTAPQTSLVRHLKRNQWKLALGSRAWVAPSSSTLFALCFVKHGTTTSPSVYPTFTFSTVCSFQFRMPAITGASINSTGGNGTVAAHGAVPFEVSVAHVFNAHWKARSTTSLKLCTKAFSLPHAASSILIKANTKQGRLKN